MSVVCYGKSGCIKQGKRKQGCESGGGGAAGVRGQEMKEEILWMDSSSLHLET